MKTVMNITTCQEDTDRYRDRDDLWAFCRGFGLDGLEVLEVGSDARGLIEPRDVVGVHLKYYSGWMDLWRGNRERLMQEYDSAENLRAVYGGEDRSALVEAYRRNLRFANAMQPEYLVFHVSECTIAESMRHIYHYTDEQVCDGAVELLNEVVGQIEGEPWLLLENLWYRGLTMERPEIVRRLLDGVRYPKVGVMLDTGHLMHTNRRLSTIDQAVDYIHRILDRYDDLRFIRGVHLHQSLTGAFAEACITDWEPMEGTYQQRLWDVMGRIFQIDTHKPFQSSRVQELLDRLPALEFLCLEQISSSRQEHAANLAEQLRYLRK